MKHKKLLKISLISLAVIVVGLLVIPGPVKDITQNVAGNLLATGIYNEILQLMKSLTSG